MSKEVNSNRRNNSKTKHITNRSKMKVDNSSERSGSSAASGKNNKCQNNKTEKKVSNLYTNGANANVNSFATSGNSSFGSNSEQGSSTKLNNSVSKEAGHGNPEFVFKEPKNGNKPSIVSRGIQTANVTQVQLRYLFSEPFKIQNCSHETSSQNEQSIGNGTKVLVDGLDCFTVSTDLNMNTAVGRGSWTPYEWPVNHYSLEKKVETLVQSCKQSVIDGDEQNNAFVVSEWQAIPMCCVKSFKSHHYR